MSRYPRTTLGPRFSRNAFSRFLASSSPCAIAAVSASVAKPAAAIAAGNPRQHVGDGEIGERRIAGDALGELERLGHAGAVVDEILRQPDRLAFFGAERAAGQHHVHHAGDADQRRQPHRAAAADENAAASLRQRVVGRAFGHADMHRGGELQSAADHRAVQHGDHRHLAELNALEGAVPGARMRDAAEHVALFQLGEVEAGAEMLAVAGQHHGANFGRQGVEERHHALHQRVVERIALLGPMQPQDRDRAALLGAERRRKIDGVQIGTHRRLLNRSLRRRASLPQFATRRNCQAELRQPAHQSSLFRDQRAAAFAERPEGVLRVDGRRQS